MILALDTTSEFGSIALVERERVVEEAPMRSPDGFGHVLYGHLQGLLDRHGARVNEIECFAAAAGPGSFTGVRIGLAAVKGLAYATGKPAFAVSNLEALACFGSAPLRAAVLDARRGEVYGAVYGRALDIVAPETVAKLEDWLKLLPAGDLEFVSTDFAAFQAGLPPSIRAVTAPRELAAAVGRIAWLRFDAGRGGDPASLDANYVRRSDAELFWKE